MTEKSRPARAKLPARSVGFWIALAFVVLLLAFLFSSHTVKDLVEGATDWAEGVMDANPVLGAAIFFLFSALSAMLAFASSTVLVPPANLAWGKLATFFLLWGGWLAGAMAAYGIGRVARPLLDRLGYAKKLHEYQQLVSSRMKFWAVLLLCIAVPSEIPGYLFGGVHYPFLRFVAAMGIAESIYAIVVVAAGESLAEAEALPVLGAVVFLVIVATGAGLLLRTLRKK